MDIKDVQNLIRFVAKSGVSEVKYKTKDFEIDIKTTVDSQAVQSHVLQNGIPLVAAPIVENKGEQKTQEDSKYITIKSPMIGTFYTKPSPDKEPFVSLGSTISVGSVVCVIEAMKLFNQIESEISGKIVEILVDDSSPVEYDQPLFLVDPS